MADPSAAIRQDLAALARDSRRVAKPQSGDAALVTGATGFFGAMLVAALLRRTSHRVVCLVRASSDEHARRRLFAQLAAQRLVLGADQDRITALAGDVTAAELGLTADRAAALRPLVTTVFHAAASVNGTVPYLALREANVVAAVRVADFADACGAALHHISTMAADVPWTADVPPLAELPSGYAQSKWVSERLLAGRARIYRLGALSGHQHTGISNPLDFRWLFLRACLDLRLAPVIPGGLCWLPVDVAADAVVAAACAPQSGATLPDPLPVTATSAVPWSQVFSWLRLDGHRLDVTSPPGWWAALREHVALEPADHLAAMAAFAPVLPSGTPRGLTGVWRALAELGAPEVPFGRTLLRTCVSTLPTHAAA